ncbi:MAG: hypothetical protein IJW03_01895 [Clostridia bacterium]|nr:hypothetical protein [Clostridia bacterium]
MKRILALVVIFTIALSLLCGCFGASRVSLGNVVILGDSFSTFEGHIPEGYMTYYKADGDHAGVKKVSHTWWHRLIRETRSNLLLNSSYSGSTVCNTGYGGEDYSGFSFVTRVRELIDNGFFDENSVDTLIIYGGLNDCWAQSPRGDIKYSEITESDLYSFYPALSLIFSSVRDHSPNTRIIYIIEEQLDNAMKDGIRQITEHYGIETVAPQGVELHYSHPTYDGMKAISDQIIDALAEN